MNIKSFKPGDLVTRNEPMRYAHNGSADGSWLGDRMEFLGIDEEAKIFFVRLEANWKENEKPYTFSFARDAWDEGWIKFPEKLFKEVSGIVASQKIDK